MDFHLAQINIARARGAVDGPVLADFMALLDPVNALADASPGFVWRMQDDAGNATSLRPYDDDRIMVNMSAWESVDALWDFVYASAHLNVMRRRREWFERFESTYLASGGFQPARSRPSTRPRRAWRRWTTHGPTPYAFTFKKRFAPEPVPA